MLFDQQGQINQLSNEVTSLSSENQEQKQVIQKLAEDLRSQKSQNHFGSDDLILECQKLQL